MNKITLTSPLDMHLHLRDGQMLEKVAPHSAKHLSGALIMPNLVPPVTSKEAVVEYKKRILDACGHKHFEPYMTLFFKDSYDKAFLQEVKDEILAIKLYPSGITTNSEGGASELGVEALETTLNAMSELGIPLCVHGESNGFVMDREKEFAPIYEALASHFPKLKIIMEHITDKTSVELLEKHDNLYATITLHHLLITLDDVAGGMLKPHLFCKPIAKREEDRQALLQAAFTSPKVMFGSDSAPHPVEKKESCGCAAGVFSAPIALEKLTELFDEHDKLDSLQDFVSTRAVQIYGITPPQKTVVLEKTPFTVAHDCDGVVPFCGDESIAWSVVSVS